MSVAATAVVIYWLRGHAATHVRRVLVSSDWARNGLLLTSSCDRCFRPVRRSSSRADAICHTHAPRYPGWSSGLFGEDADAPVPPTPLGSYAVVIEREILKLGQKVGQLRERFQRANVVAAQTEGRDLHRACAHRPRPLPPHDPLSLLLSAAAPAAHRDANDAPAACAAAQA